MIQVTRKDERESVENMLRRLSRRVVQSGVIATAKASMRYSRAESKSERRKKAIAREQRRAKKLLNNRLGKR